MLRTCSFTSPRLEVVSVNLNVQNFGLLRENDVTHAFCHVFRLIDGPHTLTHRNGQSPRRGIARPNETRGEYGNEECAPVRWCPSGHHPGSRTYTTHISAPRALRRDGRQGEPSIACHRLPHRRRLFWRLVTKLVHNLNVHFVAPSNSQSGACPPLGGAHAAPPKESRS